MEPNEIETSWYCLRSQLKHEHIAAANLRNLHGIEVLNPRIRFKRGTRRGPVWTTESLFPNYLFVKINLSSQLDKVQHTTGVSRLLKFGGHYPIIPEAVIHDLITEIGEDEVRTIELYPQVGEEVSVLEGAFEGFRAVVTRVIPAQQRVAILLEFLGRSIVVHLPVAAVETE